MGDMVDFMEDMVDFMVDIVDFMGDMVDTSHTTVTMAAGSTTTQSTDSTATAAFTITTLPCTDLLWSDNRHLTHKVNRQIVLSCVEKLFFFYYFTTANICVNGLSRKFETDGCYLRVE